MSLSINRVISVSDLSLELVLLSFSSLWSLQELAPLATSANIPETNPAVSGF